LWLALELVVDRLLRDSQNMDSQARLLRSSDIFDVDLELNILVLVIETGVDQGKNINTTSAALAAAAVEGQHNIKRRHVPHAYFRSKNRPQLHHP
jgi:hypothetical protein